MRDDILFFKHDWNRVVEAQKLAARRDADKKTNSDFNSTSIEELASHLCEKYSLEVPKLDPDNTSIKQREIEIDISHDRMRHFSTGGPHYVKGTAIDVRVPFHGDPDMFDVKPNTWTTRIPRGRVEANSIVFTISGTDLSQERVKSEIDRQINEIQQWLSFQEKSVVNFPDELAHVVKQALEARNSKLDADSSLISGLGYKVED
ncbi:hypothetical protein [Paracoccus saliphilus]|uniref:Uncharacterized protein n=1 Tax=Paracoccus saliphilus TaxID=405559 RepID=A0AA46A4V9_9RHOB|nr:hypothetical protein [Paracoccus saliphilus]WCR01382.1 hypothetical protein JHX88_10495 [Paracoccus saliphilus]SIS70243.1 hypothetical protein SAMN05421772_103104 [Paracoccus saliphilus]